MTISNLFTGGSPGAPCCPDHQPSRLGSEDHAAGPTTTSVYLIGVFVALITLFFLSLIVAYYRRRSVLVSGTIGAGLETESRRPLAPSSAPPVEIVGQQQQERGRAVGADPVGVASAVAGSSNGLLYDRWNIQTLRKCSLSTLQVARHWCLKHGGNKQLRMCRRRPSPTRLASHIDRDKAFKTGSLLTSVQVDGQEWQAVLCSWPAHWLQILHSQVVIKGLQLFL